MINLLKNNHIDDSFKDNHIDEIEKLDKEGYGTEQQATESVSLNPENILENLNKSQKEAVTSTEGYVMVPAVPGSGKTKTLAHRFAYLVKMLGISIACILCITFTRKAANEMKKRIKRLLGNDFATSFITTLHGFCVRVLHEDSGRLFFPKGFYIWDTGDQKTVLEEIYTEMNIRLDKDSFQSILDEIRKYKDKLVYLDLFTDPSVDISKIKPENWIEEIIFKYLQKQKKYFALDFSDIINCVIYLFDKKPDVLEKWQERLHYIQVDEFQDITEKEFNLICQLAGKHKNLYVTGDPDQNIFEWRGAIMEIFMDFEKVMLPTKVIKLKENYRSSPQICAAGNSLISKNMNRIDKRMDALSPDGNKPIHFHGKNNAEEMEYIISIIKERIKNGGMYKDIAILYRAKKVSEYIEPVLFRENIPYEVYSGIGFYERKEIKDTLAYMRMVIFRDDLSFKRIVNQPRRGLGKKKQEFLRSKSEAEGITQYETLKKYIDDAIFKGTGAKRFIDVIENAKLLSETLPVSELLQKLLIDIGYEEYIRESGDMDRFDNVTEFLHYTAMQDSEYGEFLSLETFLLDISTHIDSDAGNIKNCIKLTNIHNAKGLEFDTVFVAGMNDGIIPSSRSVEGRKNKGMEEERRLCFVAATRAKRELYFTENEGSDYRGNSRLPSRFLFDIENNLITRVGSGAEEHMERPVYQRIRPDFSRAKFSCGMQVMHSFFGEGIIDEVLEDKQTYNIRFEQGTKPINFDYPGLSEVPRGFAN